MAWQDGSRFLIYSGVKWGTGPKVYKGPSRDTPWNHDLLWRLYVEGEAKKGGFRIPEGADDYDNMPPFMRPLARALNPEAPSEPLYDPYEGDQFKTRAVRIDSARDNAGYTAVAGPRAMDHSKVQESIKAGTYNVTSGSLLPALEAQRAAGGAGGSRSSRLHSARSQASLATSRARASARGKRSARALGASASASRLPQLSPVGGNTDRLKRLETMVVSERRHRADLEEELKRERSARSRVESELRDFERTMKDQLSRKTLDSARMKKYEDVVSNLMTTLRSKGGASARPEV